MKGASKLLTGLLAFWMIASATPSLWHGDHDRGDRPASTAGHEHAAGAFLCDPGATGFETAVDCVLCGAKRHLARSATRGPSGISAPPAIASPIAVLTHRPSVGSELLLEPRAPPLG